MYLIAANRTGTSSANRPVQFHLTCWSLRIPRLICGGMGWGGVGLGADGGLRVCGLLWLAHFVRRAAETIFLFKFSAEKIDVSDTALELAYYYGFGWWIASFLGAQHAEPTVLTQAAGIVMWAVCEWANFQCHRTLAAMPKDRTKRTSVPHRFERGSGVGRRQSWLVLPHLC